MKSDRISFVTHNLFLGARDDPKKQVSDDQRLKINNLIYQEIWEKVWDNVWDKIQYRHLLTIDCVFPTTEHK